MLTGRIEPLPLSKATINRWLASILANLNPCATPHIAYRDLCLGVIITISPAAMAMFAVDAATIPVGPSLETGPLVLYKAANLPEPRRRAPGSAPSAAGAVIGKAESTELRTCLEQRQAADVRYHYQKSEPAFLLPALHHIQACMPGECIAFCFAYAGDHRAIKRWLA